MKNISILLSLMLCFGSVNGQDNPTHTYAAFDQSGDPFFFCNEIEKAIAINLSKTQELIVSNEDEFKRDEIKIKDERYNFFLDQASKFASIYTAVCKFNLLQN